MPPYLIVDSIVGTSTFLNGDTGLTTVEEAGVTLAALGTTLGTLLRSTECRAPQRTGVCADLVVAVGGTWHGCKESVSVSFRAMGVLQDPGICLPCLDCFSTHPCSWAVSTPSIPPLALTHGRMFQSSRVPRGPQRPGRHSHRRGWWSRGCFGSHFQRTCQTHSPGRALGG